MSGSDGCHSFASTVAMKLMICVSKPSNGMRNAQNVTMKHSYLPILRPSIRSQMLTCRNSMLRSLR